MNIFLKFPPLENLNEHSHLINYCRIFSNKFKVLKYIYIEDYKRGKFMDKRTSQELKNMLQEINYYRKLINDSICPYEKIYLINTIAYKTTEILDDINMNENMEREMPIQSSKEFTIEELAEYDGSMGKPAYVAVNGIVYDLSYISVWGGGTHFGLYAGRDLSKEFKSCHGNKVEMLKNLPVVGKIK